MSTFSEANQVRLALKMKYSQHAWYNSSHVAAVDDGFAIVVNVQYLDNKVRKIISPVVDGISIKTEVEQKKRK
jgi:hypothetical protein